MDCNRGTEERFLKEVYPWLYYPAAASVKKREVFMGFSKKLGWNIKSVTRWRRAISCFAGYGHSWCLVGVYVPQSGEKEYFWKLINKVEIQGGENIILMGDFSVVANAELKIYQRILHSKSVVQLEIPKLLKNWLKENDFIVVWGLYLLLGKV